MEEKKKLYKEKKKAFHKRQMELELFGLLTTMSSASSEIQNHRIWHHGSLPKAETPSLMVHSDNL